MLRHFRRDIPSPQTSPPTLLHIDHNLCHACGACVAVCPPDCLFLRGLTLTVNQHACTSCSRCVAVCPVKALALVPGEGAALAS